MQNQISRETINLKLYDWDLKKFPNYVAFAT